MHNVIVVVRPESAAMSRIREQLSNGPFHLVDVTDPMQPEAFEDLEPAVVLVESRDGDWDGTDCLLHLSGIRPLAQRVLVVSDPEGTTCHSLINNEVCQWFIQSNMPPRMMGAVLTRALRRHDSLVKQADAAQALKAKNEELEEMARQLETTVEQRTRLIEKAKKEWEATFDAISDPVTVVDMSFVLRRANVAAAHMANKDVRMLPGKTCYVGLFGRTEPCPGCPLGSEELAWLPTTASDTEIHSAAMNKDFRLSMFPMGGEGVESRFICYYKDVTEERSLQQRVQQSEKMAAIGQLAGGVAHELNNPIGVIRSFTQLSKAAVQRLQDEELLDNLEEIEKAAGRCETIIRGLLDFSRPSQDNTMGEVDLASVMQRALFLVRTQTQHKGLQVVESFDPELPSIRGNENQLLQVFINLIQNAAQAMGGDGRLTLGCHCDEDNEVCASVSDTGPGIPKDVLGRIFEPFFTTKDPGKGTGLGLSVSYSIVERHGGRMEVTSKVGQGTEFRVTFPCGESIDETE